MFRIEPWNEKAFLVKMFIREDDIPPITHIVVAKGSENGEKHEWHCPCPEVQIEKAIEHCRVYDFWYVKAMTLQEYLAEMHGICVFGGDE